MVSVEVLAVGRELLIGKTVNTNAHWIGRRLLRIGSMIRRMVTVTDSLDEISYGLKEMIKRRPDFIVVVGGLGPTPDDMTLRGIAIGLGRKLRLNKEAIAMIRSYYASTGRQDLPMTAPRKKMATFPEGGKPLSNNRGTAPAVRLEHSRTVIFSLPGVPSEMKSIYLDFVEVEIRRRIGRLYSSSMTMRLEGIYESSLTPILREAIRRYPEAYIKSHPRGLKAGVSIIELNVVTSSTERNAAKSTTMEIVNFLSKKTIERRGAVTSVAAK